MSKKVGYYDLDPDVLNEIISKISGDSVSYNDTALKKKINTLAAIISEMKENGSDNSFHKYVDKVTEGMLDTDLLEMINKAMKAVSGSSNDQAVINQRIEDKISSLYEELASESQARIAQDEINESAISEIEEKLRDYQESSETMFESAEEAMESSASIATMVGATESSAGESGMVPAPKKGEQNYLLVGSGQWKSPNDITVLGAKNDANNLPITNYIINVSLDVSSKKLIFTKGDGTKIEVPLASS